MKIVILGAGTVGGTLATLLSQEENDITVVDHNQNKLSHLEEEADINTVLGSSSHPGTLVKADITNSDMVVAVTGSDEVNMISCLIAKVLSKKIKTIARIRESAYLKDKTLDAINDGIIPVDIVVSPEQLITNNIRALIETPGSLQVLEFGDGLLNLVGVKADAGGPLTGHEIGDLRKHMPNVDTRVAAIFREGNSIVPQGTTTILEGDEVFFIARSKDAIKVINEMRSKSRPYKDIMLAGGGKVGIRLAEKIEKNHNVKLIESEHERAKKLSEKLLNTIVLEGNVTDKNLLHEENIENTDVFIAITNDDEANVMSCMLAKEMGAHKTISLINNEAYVDLVQDKGIDVAIVPSQITIGTFLSEVAGEDVVKVYSLRKGSAEAIEAVVNASSNGKVDVIGKELGQIALPVGATVGAILRRNKAKIAHDDVKLRENDHVILFLTDKNLLKEVQNIFSPG
ncbi:MAG: Trk system potassium transporter TrkA [Gammaproteobacteria bacterium]